MNKRYLHIDRYTARVCSAIFFQLNFVNCFLPFFTRSLLNVSLPNIFIIFSDISFVEYGLKYIAPSPATSGRDDVSEQATGQQTAKASSTGIPKPSSKDGITRREAFFNREIISLSETKLVKIISGWWTPDFSLSQK